MSDIFAKLTEDGIMLPSSSEDPRNENQIREGRELSFDYLNKAFYKYLFTKHNILLDKTRAYPAGQIMREVETYSQPLFSQFLDKTNSEEWSEIQDRFFKYAFFNDNVYLSYEPYSVLLEAVPEEDEELRDSISELDDGEPHLQIWIKNANVLDVYDRTITFSHLRTGLTMEIPDWREIMLFFEWNGHEIDRFEQWWKFGFNECNRMELIQLAMHLPVKVGEFHYDPNNKRGGVSARAFTSSIYNKQPLYMMDEGESLTLTPLMTATEFNQYQLAIFAQRDRELASLGLVANTNPKGDRLTTNENYKDIIGVAWRQNATLRNLIRLSKQMLEKWGIETEFVVCGIAEAEPLPTDPNQQNMQQQGNEVAIR